MSDDKDYFEENGKDMAICKICYKELAKYTCPRCNIRYCASTCYKSEAHAECSESFYKNCFMEGLKQYESSPDEKQKMMEMLQRFENEDIPDIADVDEENEEEDEIPLEDRMAGIDLDADTDMVWERLTEAERKEFQAMVEDGRLGNMIESWEPWWNLKERNLVQEVGKSSSKLSHPEILKKIPDIRKLMKGEPPETLRFDVVNIIYAYAYTVRLHNGDFSCLELQAADTVIRLCNVLEGKTFKDTQSALHACFQAIQKHKAVLGNSPDYSVAVLKDVENIISGPNSQHPVLYTQAALSDLHRLFKEARHQLSEELKSSSLKLKVTKQLQTEKQKYFNATKKLEFLLAWAKKHGHGLVSTLPDIEVEFCMMSTDLATQRLSQDVMEATQQEKKKETLIEELPVKSSANSGAGKSCQKSGKQVTFADTSSARSKVTLADSSSGDNSVGKSSKARETDIEELD